MDRYTMISQDCHAGAPWYVYRKYMDPAFREDYDRWLSKWLDGVTRVGQAEIEKEMPFQFATMSAGRQREYLEAMEKSMGHLGNWDPGVRARELDREGIAGEVVFCDGSQKNYPPFGMGFVLRHVHEKAPYEHRLAGCKAHNRWLAEFCQTNKGRHAGIALVTMDHPDDTVEEIRWARKNGLFGGIMLPALGLLENGHENLWHHPRYEPIWQACAEYDMPVNTHQTATGIQYGGSPQIPIIENQFVAFRPFWLLLWSGVFERYPNLKFCPTESGGMMPLWFNAYYDEYLVKYRNPEATKQALKMKPSDYWYRQCFIGASAHSSRAEIDDRHRLGIKNILWGSDYPHPEGTWPASIERTKELFAGVPVDEVRLMIGMNTARVYGFDIELMDRIAARIGPRVSDLSTVSADA